MMSRVKQEPADERIQEREEREQGSQPGDDVMKNRQQLQMFGVLVHALIGLLPLAFAPDRSREASGSTSMVMSKNMSMSTHRNQFTT